MTEKATTPYNIREKQEKNAAYRSLIRAELADELYDKILNIIIIEKRYRDKNFSAKSLSISARDAVSPFTAAPPISSARAIASFSEVR